MVLVMFCGLVVLRNHKEEAWNLLLTVEMFGRSVVYKQDDKDVPGYGRRSCALGLLWIQY